MDVDPADPTDPPWPKRCEITAPEAIALLTDLRGFTFLSPFLSSTHTLTTAARAAKRPVSSMAHWVPRFVETGLLERVGEVRRAGAPMPRYRTPARKLVVPFELIPFDTRVRMLDEGRMRLLRRFMDGMDEELAASKSFGLSFAAYGQQLDGRWRVGDVLEGDVHRYPGRRELRAVIAGMEPVGTGMPVTTSLAGACAQVGAALGEVPWLERWPVTVLATPTLAAGHWVLADATGTLPLAPGPALPELIAVSGGGEVALSAEWTARGLVPLAVHLADRNIDVGPRGGFHERRWRDAG